MPQGSAGAVAREPPDALDFSLRGLATVRVSGATAADRATLVRQLGPLVLPAPAPGEPDLRIRFVDQLGPTAGERYVGLGEAAFTETTFLLLRTRHKAPARVAIPLDRVGDGCEILCQRGLPAVPLLIPILNLTLLRKGILPLHATAFVHQGRGILATGWSKGGKTELLLAFARHGARYVGDEWVYLCPDGRRMVGVPEPIRLWDWHLRSLPEVRARVAPADRRRLRLLGLLAGTARVLTGFGPRRRLARRALDLIEGQCWVQVPPATLFGPDGCLPEAELTTVCLVASHADAAVTVAPIAADEVARRIVASLQFERLPLTQAYWQFRFAFPERRNRWLETVAATEEALALRYLGDKTAYAVWHPYPVAIPSLFDAVQPVLAGS